MASSSAIQLIVGLGNPGPEYAKTRHNAGVWLVEMLAEHNQGRWQAENKFHGQVCRITLSGQEVWLLFPTTFMNHSGQAVKALSNFYKIPAENILIIHDELDFPPGTVRLKQGGGHGGHNGLRDIAQQLGSNNFYRLRIGIGHPGHKDRVHDYVLSRPNKQDFSVIIDAIMQALPIIPDLVAGNIQTAMQNMHTSVTS